MKSFFSDIRTQLLNNVTGLKTVELWNTQIEATIANEAELPIVTPAVYLSIPEEIEYRAFTCPGVQEGRFTFTVYIVTDNLIDNGFDDQGTDWDFLDFKQSVYKVLEGFKPTDSTKELNRTTEILNSDHGGYYVFSQSYSANYVDNEAEPPTTEAENVALDLKTDLIIDNVIVRTGRTDRGEGSELDFELDSELL
jgi:hypothetical protein